MGVLNTLIDTGLFLFLHDQLGILAANFVSTSAGMTFSFVVNGLFTFRAQQLTVQHALLFLATTGTTLWIAQPLVIFGLLTVIDSALVAKLIAIGASIAMNFAAYRFVVWPSSVPVEPAAQPAVTHATAD